MAVFYDLMEKIIFDEGLKLSPPLEDIKVCFDLAGSGIDFDIGNYIKNKRDCITLIDLIRKSLNLYLETYESVDEKTKKDLDSFYKELLFYAESQDPIMQKDNKDQI